jgi:GAF domain-containing protein
MPRESRLNSENLIDLAYALSQQNQFEEILRLVAQRTVALLHAQVALITMVNPQTRQTVKTVIREGREEQAVKYRVVQDQINGWMMKFSQPLLSQDIKTDPRFAKVKLGELAIKSVAAVLIKIEGVVLGSLSRSWWKCSSFVKICFIACTFIRFMCFLSTNAAPIFRF